MSGDLAHVDHVTTSGDTADKVREWSSVIGIVTAIVGNILISFALNIQRYAHIRLGREKENSHRDASKSQQEEIAEERSKINLETSKRPIDNGSQPSRHASFSSESSSQSTVKPTRHGTAADTRTYLSSPYWWAGIVLMVIGEGGNFLAYGFAPASIVSPLGVVALVSNCIIAPWLLKERFRARDLLGVLVAVAGAVVVVISAKNSETKMGPSDIWSAITRWEFELYLGITAVLIAILIWASGRYGERSILIDIGLVGLFGGYTALSTKGVASLLSYTLWRALTFPITYLLLAVLIGSAVSQIRYINRALQRFDSTQVIPTQFVLFTISVIIGSAVLYRDFESATASRVGEFAGGCLLTFVGVYFITSGRSQESYDDDHVDDEEHAIGLIDEEAQHDESLLNNTFATPSPHSSRRSSAKQAPSSPHTPQRHHLHSLSRSSTDPQTPLTENPWTDSDNFYTPPTRPRPRHLEPTISTPLLPSDAQRSSPSSPLRRLSPSKRPSTLSRHSITHLRPGPYMSPLSSSLSAIVADSLRRGVHDSPSSARRRPRLDAMRRNKSQRPPDDVEGEVSPLKSVTNSDDGGGGEGVVEEGEGEGGRKQSIGAALGEFLRLKFLREREGKGGGGGDEEGDGGEDGR
ncbi:MAG: hypothetical protein Q9220_002232 [cf. Caloplaca sp. 1 TL-2023]